MSNFDYYFSTDYFIVDKQASKNLVAIGLVISDIVKIINDDVCNLVVCNLIIEANLAIFITVIYKDYGTFYAHIF